MRSFSILCLLTTLIFQSACSFKGVHRSYDISYIQADNSLNLPEKQLDVYAPKRAESTPVLIFIHGGSWNSGNKNIYRFLGARMARKGITTVIINYPLSPDYDVRAMVQASALATNWTADNIAQYGGDPQRIFISGHSAGGHLAAVLNVREEPFEDLGLENPLQGAVLIDAAGLDMKWFLEQMDYAPGTEYRIPFTDDPKVWEATSPIYFLDANIRPQMILMGGKTLPGIALTTERYLEASKKAQSPVEYHLQKSKKHKGMIVQFANTINPIYKKIHAFMEK